ncbi:Hypothetical predicted protein [Pelobates cultripes]|uniref:Uncharacterized protein n=1 Tax=Pelobates cultripes TaxID=61616 RepID=A0AAD1S3U4_PELCU|nr:Hypothetical predicted protein [Pelobates cultripes]
MSREPPPGIHFCMEGGGGAWGRYAAYLRNVDVLCHQREPRKDPIQKCNKLLGHSQRESASLPRRVRK